MATRKVGKVTAKAPARRAKPGVARSRTDSKRLATSSDVRQGAERDAPEHVETTIEKVHQAVKAHQSRVFGTIFGIGQPHERSAAEGRKDPWGAAARAIADPLGLRKFEDVFDQRVATALERLGWPTPEELRHLREQVETVAEYLRTTDSRSGRTNPKR